MNAFDSKSAICGAPKRNIGGYLPGQNKLFLSIFEDYLAPFVRVQLESISIMDIELTKILVTMFPRLTIVL